MRFFKMTLGTRATLVASFEKNGAPADPSTVTMAVTPPDGVVVVGDATRIRQGVYSYDVVLNQVGEWTIRADGSDPVDGSAEQTIVVPHSYFA